MLARMLKSAVEKILKQGRANIKALRKLSSFSPCRVNVSPPVAQLHKQRKRHKRTYTIGTGVKPYTLCV